MVKPIADASVSKPAVEQPHSIRHTIFYLFLVAILITIFHRPILGFFTDWWRSFLLGMSIAIYPEVWLSGLDRYYPVPSEVIETGQGNGWIQLGFGLGIISSLTLHIVAFTYIGDWIKIAWKWANHTDE